MEWYKLPVDTVDVQYLGAGYTGAAVTVTDVKLRFPRVLKFHVAGNKKDVLDAGWKMDALRQIFPAVHHQEPPDGTSSYWRIWMDLAEGVSLSSILAEDQVSAEVRGQIAMAIVRAVALMHQHDFSHGDLWPDNIFVAGTHETVMFIDPGRSSAGSAFPHAQQLVYDRQRLSEIVDALVPFVHCRELFAIRGAALTVGAIADHVSARIAAKAREPWAMPSALLRHFIAFDAATAHVSGTLGDFIQAARKRTRDCYLLTEFFDHETRILSDVVAALILEASHRIDDFYDSPMKWQSYRHDSITAVYALATSAIDTVLGTHSRRAEVRDAAVACIREAEQWTKADKDVGQLAPAEAIARVESCNAASYATLFGVVSHLGPTPTAMEPVFRHYGFLAWVADDWRDLELDNATNHFNIFRYYFFNLQQQFKFRHDLIESRLAQLGTGAVWLRELFLKDLGLETWVERIGSNAEEATGTGKG